MNGLRALVGLVFTAAGLVWSSGTASAQSLTLSPAVVPLGGRPGQSTTQRLTLRNATDMRLSFDIVAKDVVVKDGTRVFVAAGEVPGSIAATAVLSRRRVTMQPHDERAVDVTLTLPARATHRAVVILFQGTTRIGPGAGATISLGTLLTFNLPGRESVASGDLHVVPQSTSKNASFSIGVTNDGSEPTIPRGAAVILDAGGSTSGKVTFPPQRLLPGERATLRAEYLGELSPGTYRVIATIASSDRSWSRTSTLVVR